MNMSVVCQSTGSFLLYFFICDTCLSYVHCQYSLVSGMEEEVNVCAIGLPRVFPEGPKIIIVCCCHAGRI